MSDRGADAPIPANQVIRISAFKRIVSVILNLVALVLRLANALRKSNPQKVIVLEPVGLGDMITLIPLVRELLNRRFEVTVAAKPEWRPLFADCDPLTWVNTRVPWASQNERIKYQPSLYFKNPTRGDLKQLRAVAPGSIGIETRGDIRCAILLYWAGCKRVISLSTYLGTDLRIPRFAAELVPFNNNLRRWAVNLGFLRHLDRSADLALVAPPRVDHFIRKQPNRRVALIPVAPWAGKLWSPERWKAVATALLQQGWDVVTLCGPNQTSKAREQVGPDLPVVESSSLDQWAEQFNRCSFVITLDTGPMHLADALDVPVIALYGQGKLPLWAPSGPRSIVLAHQDSPDFFVCHPIDENTHLGQKFMNKITVEEVLAAAEKVARERSTAEAAAS